MKTLAPTVVFILLTGCASIRPHSGNEEKCDRIASLADDGELKPAVDEMSTLEKKGIVCPEKVRVAIDGARARLAEADALVLSAQSKRQLGELEGASSDLERALEVYPKYFWAEKQLRDVRGILSENQAEGRLQTQRPSDVMLSQSRTAETRGDLVEASRLTSEILDNPPADPDSRSDLVEYSRLLGLKLFSEGELTKARDLWRQALSLDPSNQKILDYLEDVDQSLRSLEQIKARDDG
jgi:tetratricopeptide (TPR) repeat protein